MSQNVDEHFLAVSLAVGIVLIAAAVGISNYGSTGSLGLNNPMNRPSGPGALPPLPPGAPISVNGIVKSTTTNGFVVSGIMPGKQQPSDVTVVVDSATKILKQTPKDPQAWQKEMAEFQKVMNASRASTSTFSALPAPPMPFVTTELTLSDIEVGMMVSASSAPGSTQQESTIAAVTVVVQATPTPAAPPTATPPPPPPPPPAATP